MTISISQRKAISGGVKPGGSGSAMLVVVEGRIEAKLEVSGRLVTNHEPIRSIVSVVSNYKSTTSIHSPMHYCPNLPTA